MVYSQGARKVLCATENPHCWSRSALHLVAHTVVRLHSAAGYSALPTLSFLSHLPPARCWAYSAEQSRVATLIGLWATPRGSGAPPLSCHWWHHIACDICTKLHSSKSTFVLPWPVEPHSNLLSDLTRVSGEWREGTASKCGCPDLTRVSIFALHSLQSMTMKLERQGVVITITDKTWKYIVKRHCPC